MDVKIRNGVLRDSRSSDYHIFFDSTPVAQSDSVTLRDQPPPSDFPGRRKDLEGQRGPEGTLKRPKSGLLPLLTRDGLSGTYRPVRDGRETEEDGIVPMIHSDALLLGVDSK